MRMVLADSLTAPMTIDELSKIFGVGFRAMKAHLNEIGTTRVGKLHRVPIRMMPEQWLTDRLLILAQSGIKPHFDRDTA